MADAGAPWRVVLDTNAVLSALVFRAGRAGALRLAWQDGALRPLTSTATARELVRVLAYPKFRLTSAQREELLGDYLPWTETVAVPEPPPAAPACRDPADMPFVHLALAGCADALVTGDRDLLAMASSLPLPVLTPDAFLNTLHAPRS